MKIYNAAIRKIRFGCDDRHPDSLSVRMDMDSGTKGVFYDIVFYLASKAQTEQLYKLLRYTGENEVAKMEGHIVRVVLANCELQAFGHPIEDAFTIFGEKMVECQEADLPKYFK